MEKQERKIGTEDSTNIVVELNDEDVPVSNEKNNIFFDLVKWQDDFAFNSKINCFNEDSISHFENIVWKDENAYNNYSAPIIGDLASQIEGIEKLEPWHMEINEGTDFLYSIQKKQNHIGITVIGGNDSWITEIRYLAFNQKGKKIGDVVLAAKGGDGGYYTKGHGCFKNDSTYIYEYVETEYNFEKEVDEILETGELKYIIHSTGRIETKKNK